MPADADLLCGYYLSSNLVSKKSPNGLKKMKSLYGSDPMIHNKLNTAGEHMSTLTTTTTTDTTIEFVKFTKNPMDSIKQKYELLKKTTTLTVTNGTADSDDKSEQVTKQQTIVEVNVKSTSPSTISASAALTTTVKQTDLNQLFKNSAWLDLNWSKIRKIGIGLLNLGNNCYLNATLQCLAYTPPLSQWLVSKPHSPMCKFKSVKGFCSLCEVEKIIFDIFNSPGGFAKPNNLCFNIKKISNVFGIGTQEDASEFFTTLLESMAKSIKFTLNSNAGLLNHNINTTNSTNGKTKRTTTILDDIFSFQFRSRITCCNCGRLSDTIEHTNTWPVDVKYVQDIRKGMLHFLREEVLDGENAYKCDKCNKKTRATKKYSIRTAPNILVIHLKRFDFSYAGKLSHFVTYPETLSLKTFIPEQTVSSNSNVPSAALAAAAADSSHEKSLRNVSYKLYGVLVHLGYTSHSGHYYSYVRSPNDVWYKADDQRVSVVSSSDALAQNAYILFYSRVTSPNSQVDSTPSLKSPSTSVAETSSFKFNIPKLISEPVEQSLPYSYNSCPSQSSLSQESPVKAVYGPQLPPKLAELSSETTTKNSNTESVVESKKKIRRRKLKQLYKAIRSGDVSGDTITSEQTKLAKSSAEKRKLKKLLRKMSKKISTTTTRPGTTSQQSELTKIKRKLDADCEIELQGKKMKLTESPANGLALLRSQYDSSPSSSSSSGSSPKTSSLSSMSSTSIKSEASTSSSSKPIPSSVKISPEPKPSSSSSSSSQSLNVFNQIKDQNSLGNVKTWDNSISSKLVATNGHRFNSDDATDPDQEYNDEFDKPQYKSKHQNRNRIFNSTSFHTVTHSNHFNSSNHNNGRNFNHNNHHHHNNHHNHSNYPQNQSNYQNGNKNKFYNSHSWKHNNHNGYGTNNNHHNNNKYKTFNAFYSKR